MNSDKPANPIILALDVQPDEAKSVIADLKDSVEIIKIGSRLFTALGPQVVDWVHQAGRMVFLDLKFHDIPQTVAEACANAVRMKVWGLTIHASGGFAMMSEAARVVSDQAKQQKITKPLIFGVTVLTSLSDPELKEVGVESSSIDQVRRLALLAKKSGLDGTVSSGLEIETVRGACGKDFLVMVPGIRSGKNLKNDQKRVMTPETALKLGANYLVVGRPILDAADRKAAARELLAEIKRL